MSPDAPHSRWLDAVFLIGFAVVFTYIAHFQYRSQYSGRSLDDLAVFVRVYSCSIFVYRPLMRDSLLALNQLLFSGDNLYVARAIQNGLATLALNVAVALLATRFGVRRSGILRIVLQVDLMIVACLFVNANPYTIPMVALVYFCVLGIETNRLALALCALVVGMLTHELAAIGGVYMLCRLAGSEKHWPDRSAIQRNKWRLLATLAAVVVPYVALRLMLSPSAGCEPESPFFQEYMPRQLKHFPAWAGITVDVGIFVAFLDRRILERLVREGKPHVIPFFASALPLLAYLALFAILVEIRQFLPFFPLLAIAAADREPQSPA